MDQFIQSILVLPPPARLIFDDIFVIVVVDIFFHFLELLYLPQIVVLVLPISSSMKNITVY